MTVPAYTSRAAISSRSGASGTVPSAAHLVLEEVDLDHELVVVVVTIQVEIRCRFAALQPDPVEHEGTGAVGDVGRLRVIRVHDRLEVVGHPHGVEHPATIVVLHLELDHGIGLRLGPPVLRRRRHACRLPCLHAVS